MNKIIRRSMRGYTMLLAAGVVLAGCIFPPLFALGFFIPVLRRRHLSRLIDRMTYSFRLHAASIEGMGRIGDALARR